MGNRLGAFVKEKREAMGLSQRALARKAKVSATSINRLEAGESTPETGTLEALASALNVPFSRMLDIAQGRVNKEGKSPLLTLIEELPDPKRRLAEDIIKLIRDFEG